jgi:spermidine synthase
VLGTAVTAGSFYLLLLPFFAEPVLQFYVWGIDDIKLGSLAAALTIMAFPVTMLGMYSPFAIRLLLRSERNSGAVSGAVYGVSTAGSIVGTLGTTFFLIPLIGSRAITIALGILGIFGGALLAAVGRWGWLRRAGLGALALLLATPLLLPGASPVAAEELFDPQIRANMLAHKDGLITHVETLYNDIFVSKDKNLLALSFQWKGWVFQESQVDLANADALPMLYTRAMSLAAIYPQDIKRVLIIGLGAGSIPYYLGRFLPNATIDTVELDPGVIDAAKKYFGLRETERSHFIESDGRVFLNRHRDLYDIIIVDAFTGSYIPFHLMTKEFYRLVHDRLSPHGVAAFNIIPSVKLFDSNVRTLRLAFDNIDFFNSGDPDPSESNVVVIGRLDPLTDAETLQKAAVAQARYKFPYDVSQLLTARRIGTPRALHGEVLTDDFAPVNVLDANGRRYRRKK